MARYPLLILFAILLGVTKVVPHSEPFGPQNKRASAYSMGMYPAKSKQSFPSFLLFRAKDGTYGFNAYDLADFNTDTDGDEVPDYLDKDDDNDGIPDSIETGLGELAEVAQPSEENIDPIEGPQRVVLNETTTYITQDDHVHNEIVELPDKLLRSTAPAGGYRVSVSWMANNGLNHYTEADHRNASESVSLELFVNGTLFWTAISPMGCNRESGDNRVMNAAVYESSQNVNVGRGFVWPMDTGPNGLNKEMVFRLPLSITSIENVEMRISTGRGAHEGDDGELRINYIDIGPEANSTHAVDNKNITYENHPVSGNLLENDYDRQNDVQTIAQDSYTTEAGGTVTVDRNTGEYVYFPLMDFIGTDRFTYRLCDNNVDQACDDAEVEIEVVEFDPRDTDDDGIPDYLDLDSDNDGISDLEEGYPNTSGLDVDRDGQIDTAFFVDDDDNGQSDTIDALGEAILRDTLLDSDRDGTPNYLDLDSDNDLIPDIVEAHSTEDFVIIDEDVRNDDTDGDGVLDVFDSSTRDFGGSFADAEDTDNDGQPDYLDSDSDGDGISDLEEGVFNDPLVTYTDPNGNIDDILADLKDEISGNAEVAFRETCEVPPLDTSLTDMTVCDGFTLPPLPNGGYFTEPNGEGTQLPAGEEIVQTRTIYLYDGVIDECFVEREVTITINGFLQGPLLGDDLVYCNGLAPLSITPIQESMAHGEISHQWYSMASGETDFSPIPGGTEASYTPLTTTGTLRLKRVDTSILNGQECTTESNSMEVTFLPALSVPEPEVALLPCSSDYGNGASRITIANISGGTLPVVTYDFIWDGGTPSDSSDDVVMQASADPVFVYEGRDSRRMLIAVTDSGGCTVTTEVTLDERPALDARIAMVEQDLCAGENRGSVLLEISGGLPPYETQMVESGNGFEEGLLLYENLTGGSTYTFLVRDSNGCEMLLEAELDPPTLLSASYSIANVCRGEDGYGNLLLVALQSSDIEEVELQYVLRSDADGTEVMSTEPLLMDIAAGSYELVVAHPNGCLSEPVAVTVPELPSPIEVVANMGMGNQITIEASGGVAPYTYSFNGSAFGNESTFVITASGTYEVIARDSLGCEATLEVSAEFLPITVPNYFTPDGDNINNGWRPRNTEAYPNIETYIYDRYGRLLHILRQDEEWYGYYQNEEMPTGDYWYIIKLDGHIEILDPIVGNFTLYR